MKIAKAPSVFDVGFRAASVLSRMGIFLAESSLIHLRTPDKNERMKKTLLCVQKTTQIGLDLLNFEVEVAGLEPGRFQGRTFLIVSNHMSYMDVLVLASIHPSVFITSVDMGEKPLLGQLALMGGSLFIERRHRGHVERDLAAMTDVLKRGFDVLIFPEGTSTNGLQISPFKKSLLMSAAQAGVDILPVALKYSEIDGQPFGPENCDDVAWHGDMSFAPHLLSLLQKRKVKVRVEFLEPISVSTESTRDELAEKSRTAIANAYFAPLH